MGAAKIEYGLEYAPDFVKAAKTLTKRYRSFPKDLEIFIKDLMKNPLSGIDLGNGIRKFRMKIASKGRGKSGGARVITLTAVIEQNKATITLLYVYDKSDIESLSKQKIQALIDANNLGL